MEHRHEYDQAFRRNTIACSCCQYGVRHRDVGAAAWSLSVIIGPDTLIVRDEATATEMAVAAHQWPDTFVCLGSPAEVYYMTGGPRGPRCVPLDIYTRSQVAPGVSLAYFTPYRNDSFDTVFAVNSLHHWPESLVGLREVRRVLKPGGLIAIIEQPRSAQTDAQIQDLGAALASQLTAVGFGQVRVEWKPMRPATSVGTLGIKAPEPIGASTSEGAGT